MMRLRRSNAFTFIEVIAALAIVAIALLGLLHLHLLSVRMADTAQTTAQAVFVAKTKIADTLCSPQQRTGTKSGTVETNGYQFTWRTAVTSADAPPLQKFGLRSLRQLQVDVMWREGAGQKSIQMTTYVADTKINE